MRFKRQRPLENEGTWLCLTESPPSCLRHLGTSEPTLGPCAQGPLATPDTLIYLNLSSMGVQVASVSPTVVSGVLAVDTPRACLPSWNPDSSWVLSFQDSKVRRKASGHKSWDSATVRGSRTIRHQAEHANWASTVQVHDARSGGPLGGWTALPALMPSGFSPLSGHGLGDSLLSPHRTSHCLHSSEAESEKAAGEGRHPWSRPLASMPEKCSAGRTLWHWRVTKTRLRMIMASGLQSG